MEKMKSVRDIRSDHHGKLHHMYSMVAVKARVTPPPFSTPFVRPNLIALPSHTFLPTQSDISKLELHLSILVSRILCDHMPPFLHLSKLIPKHIYHTHSNEMSQPSEAVVIDVLHRNEAKNDDMLIIMKTMQSYMSVGNHKGPILLSGGDQLTCERPRAACNGRRHPRR